MTDAFHHRFGSDPHRQDPQAHAASHPYRDARFYLHLVWDAKVASKET